MEYKDIRELAELMKEMGLTALEYAEGDASIRMERGGAQTAAAACAPSKTDEAEEGSGVCTVTSPMVGVFYAGPAADKKPYVSLGDHVNAGDVLCIVEAMKMMNEITAEKSGVVAEVCVGNKQIVEYGHPLFRIRLD